MADRRPGVPAIQERWPGSNSCRWHSQQQSLEHSRNVWDGTRRRGRSRRSRTVACSSPMSAGRASHSPRCTGSGTGTSGRVGHIHWDVLGLYRGILDGLRNGGPRRTPGLDRDRLLGSRLRTPRRRRALLGNPVHYRDDRTLKVVGPVVDERRSPRTSIAAQASRSRLSTRSSSLSPVAARMPSSASHGPCSSSPICWRTG